ncbi:MAG: lipoate--protein ligase family protein [Candidatus Methanofastidiosia archaeon]
MALDEALLEARIDGKIEDTLRFYRFKPSAISIGYFQSLRKEINIEKCKEHGVDVVRRITGGGAVFHDTFGEITYSIVIDAKSVPTNISESFGFICKGLVESLDVLGIRAEFHEINDVLVGERKISGSAQTRRKGMILQHGTLLYRTDIEKMFEVLNVSEEKISDKFIQSVNKRVTTIEREIGKIDDEKVLSALEAGFSRVFGTLNVFSLPEEILEMTRELEQHKYSDESFIFLR